MIKKQQGFSAYSAIFYLVLAGIVMVYGTQIIMGYVEKGTMKQVLKTVVTDIEQQESPARPKDVVEHVMKSMEMSNITLSQDDIEVTNPTGTPNKYNITVSHYKQINITSKIYLMMDLGVTQEAD